MFKRDQGCRSAFIITFRLRIVWLRCFGWHRYPWLDAVSLGAILKSFTCLLLLLIGLCLMSPLAVHHERQICCSMEMFFDPFKLSFHWGYVLDRGLESIQYLTPWNLIMSLVALYESFHCCLICFELMGVDSHLIICSLVEVDVTPHCSVECSVLIGLLFLHFFQQDRKVTQAGVWLSPSISKPLYSSGLLCLSLSWAWVIVPWAERSRSIFNFVRISIWEYVCVQLEIGL